MPSLPANSYLPINRCNLPAQILGSLSFQHHPVEILIDGIHELHKDFFKHLKLMPNVEERTIAFGQYMNACFSLGNTDGCGSDESYERIRADYLCMLRGWMFDSNNREGAVLKGWVESRFGLMPRWHKSKINTPYDESYTAYMHDRTTGIYNTNAIEAQLDLLYSYCQYEARIHFLNQTHIKLFRGTDFVGQYDIIKTAVKNKPIVLMNNINSLSSSIERADEFGATLFEIKVPIEKIFYFDELLNGKLQGEAEYIAIGGLYEIKMLTP